MDPILGYRRFVDGTTRPIFEDLNGRQYVKDDFGQPVYGVWHFDPDNAIDVPLIAKAQSL